MLIIRALLIVLLLGLTALLNHLADYPKEYPQLNKQSVVTRSTQLIAHLKRASQVNAARS